MISNRELRIGNLVTLSGSLILTVYEIHEDCFYAKDAKGSSFKNTWADIQPIPLSEEVLLKCGFKRIANLISGSEIEIVYYQNGKIIVYLLKDFFEIEIETSSGIFNLHHTFEKHLHQLQNLYYALTGEELEVSL